jgi:hypothetical protein
VASDFSPSKQNLRADMPQDAPRKIAQIFGVIWREADRSPGVKPVTSVKRSRRGSLLQSWAHSSTRSARQLDGTRSLESIRQKHRGRVRRDPPPGGTLDLFPGTPREARPPGGAGERENARSHISATSPGQHHFYLTRFEAPSSTPMNELLDLLA